MIFHSYIASFTENTLMYEHHIPIPNEVYRAMLEIALDKRVKCVFDGNLEHYCAMLPKKDDYHYILLNKDIMKKMNWKKGDKVSVDIQKQELKYGIPICDELQETLNTDEEGSQLFHRLTMGTQRSLIHLINKYKNPHLRAERSILLLRHLTLRNGNLDFKILQQSFKEGF